MWNPWSLFEIDWVQGAAPSGPVIGSAAEVSESATVEGKIGKSHIFSPVQVLGIARGVQPSTFQKANFSGRAGKLAGKGNAGRTGSDDANLAPEGFAFFNVAGIDVHAEARVRIEELG